MRAAYVDTSSVLAICFLEPGHRNISDGLDSYDETFSSNLMEAECLAAMMREEIESPAVELLDRVVWVLPDRLLTREFTAVLAAGCLRGADLWHLACALYVKGSRHDIDFLTLDQRQRDLAQRLGFHTP